MTTKKATKKNKKGAPLQDDFTLDLIRQLNKENGEQIAFNLSSDDAPTKIKRWISTGSRQLDCLISNQSTGGFPEGRVVEIQGPTSCGKSHIAFEAAKATQKMGGIVVYIDTENATSLDNLSDLGIDTSRRFIFCQTACTEEIFAIVESTIMKARAMEKDVPVTIVWDSIAASSPKAELEGSYEQNTIGLQARTLGRGMRKIVNIIGNQNVLFLLINQQRVKIGVNFGDPTTTPGGNAIPYASSVRVRISSTGQQHVFDKDKNVIGIKVKAKTIKNRVARPFRTCEFQIIFGVGVVEHEEVFDLFRAHCEDVMKKDPDAQGVRFENTWLTIEGTSAWKTFSVTDIETGEILITEKSYKADFGNILYNPAYEKYMDALYTSALVMKREAKEHLTFAGVDSSSIEEANAVKGSSKR